MTGIKPFATTPEKSAGASAAVVNPATIAVVSPKIQADHRQRLAIVYVRQSSPHQVLHHRESREIQYALADRAVAMGWPRERVVVIDDDQGTTGKIADHRDGFHRLIAEVTMEHVGVILGSEMSRLVRSSNDWHHLFDMCGIFGTILADLDGVYDAKDPNDRLLLGLKGIISEVELHTMRTRLYQGLMNKAHRGELFTSVPIGYVRVPPNEVALDPDQEVQSVVRSVFEKFEELGSVSAVLNYLVKHGIRIGVRRHSGCNRGQLEWHRPVYSTLLTMLHHPMYSGAYCRGRHTTNTRKVCKSGRPGRRAVPMNQWQVLRKNDLPAYITWEQYEANQRQMQQNHARASSLGSVREGLALLSGLLVCGKCGGRMVVAYKHKTLFRYSCFRQQAAYGGDPCQAFTGCGLDELVGQKVLSVLEPATVELSLQASQDMQRERDRLAQNWKQRLERAQYEVDRAARQYHGVEPENRLVARELEQRWEKALCERRQLEEEHDRFVRDQPQQLTTEEQENIRALSSSIPALWQAHSTTPADRQGIIRHLVERVVVTVRGQTEFVDVTIHWAGGFVSQHEILRPVLSYGRLRDFQRLKDRIESLHGTNKSFVEIADQLNREKFRASNGRTHFTPAMVSAFLRKYCGKHFGPGPDRYRELLKTDEWMASDLAQKLHIPKATLNYWQHKGWLLGRRVGGTHGVWIYWADEKELDRLQRLRACRRSYADLAQPFPKELTTPAKRKKG